MPKVIYISGPMTGIDDANRAAFNSAQKALEERGFVVLNPAINPDGLTYEQYMRIDMAMLAVCNSIYMLNGYENSKGATAELAYAKCVGFEVFYEDNGLLNKKPNLKLCTELSPENVDN